ncbi:predicted protein [Sclerotinia sclerotiorum 1980 UF-70]|uniref:Uncharacterized protein n=1 Tax=Sclerotinia sclerotiorum (strain ATCC 18683 / 1980 / Ss-1) TaxID=665079 RepID=A7F3Z7_SCLS1|nr:predicted protein [Sclerotinia sclerotiorum 1980 UF-70]EDN97468.1 predicted protein [Sclerotinia sclerotiorum 1980 UF-70]
MSVLSLHRVVKQAIKATALAEMLGDLMKDNLVKVQQSKYTYAYTRKFEVRGGIFMGSIRSLRSQRYHEYGQ